ncbi:MAG: hypothetical protein J0H49_36350 [Acidobacteria bacterium]|nr:hypothetical protein [Acidobacteriota bacterium]
MNVNPALITAEAKRLALSRVLQSDTFARADQLKRFLSYVCEMEINGHAGEITEYRIGLEALGKSEDYSTTDDTSVRNRAYTLRKKLEKFYEEEDPDAPLRIEFVKGTYVPRFVEPGSALHDHGDHVPVASDSHTPRVTRPWYRRFGVPALLLAAGIVVGAIGAEWKERPASATTGKVDPIVREAWGSFLENREPVIISLGTPAQLTLLPFNIKMEWQPELPEFEAPPQLFPWYVRHHRLFSGKKLYMTPDVNSPHFGDVLGATTVIRTLTAAGTPYKLLPERVISTALLNSRDSILFGVPYKSEAVLKLFEKTPFQFTYQPEMRDVEITYQATPGAALKIYSPKRDERNDRVESYSLITVMPRDPSDEKAGRVIAFSGDPSAGAAAAAEFFSSPQYLSELKQRFAAAGHPAWPAAYQVLVRCKLDANLPASMAYEAHAILNVR